jgi:hypothetical protein
MGKNGVFAVQRGLFWVAFVERALEIFLVASAMSGSVCQGGMRTVAKAETSAPRKTLTFFFFNSNGKNQI